jgi:hypothetical protein
VFVAAVEADVAVAAEQCLVGERRHMTYRRHHSALARDDAVNVHVRLGAVETRLADCKHRIAERPHHQFARIETNGVLPAQPFDRLTGYVEP